MRPGTERPSGSLQSDSERSAWGTRGVFNRDSGFCFSFLSFGGAGWGSGGSGNFLRTVLVSCPLLVSGGLTAFRSVNSWHQTCRALGSPLGPALSLTESGHQASPGQVFSWEWRADSTLERTQCLEVATARCWARRRPQQFVGSGMERTWLFKSRKPRSIPAGGEKSFTFAGQTSGWGSRAHLAVSPPCPGLLRTRGGCALSSAGWCRLQQQLRDASCLCHSLHPVCGLFPVMTFGLIED